MKTPITYLSLGLAAGTLLFSGCGKPAGDDASAAPASPAEVTIPDAPDAAMKTIFTELADGNGGILWKAMPESYQGDVNKVVQLAGTKIDAEMYDQSFALIGRLGEVAGKQKDFLLNMSMLEGQGPELKQQVEQAVPALVQVFDLISKSDIATSAGLKSFEGQKFFDSTVSQIAKLSMELAKFSDVEQPSLDDLRDAVFTVVEQTDTSATLNMKATGEEQTEELVKVEGRWVPADLANDWTSSVAEAISELEAIKLEDIAAQKPQIMGVITMLDGVLTQIEAAETQEQFDQALQGAMMPIMGLMMMGGGMGGSAPAMPMPGPSLPTAP
ncbi:MAG: hypothetical protein ACSHYA_13575 [Opitutaceae bacterium]